MDEIGFANERVEHMTAAAIHAAFGDRPGRPSSGCCHACGEPIEPARLRAHPFASPSRDCAAEEEAERTRAKKAGRR